MLNLDKLKVDTRISIALLFICSLCVKVNGQKRVLNFDAGISVTKPDKRIFNNSNTFAKDLITSDRSSLLNEFLLRFTTEFSLGRKTQLTTGLGASIIFNDVSRFIDHPYFFPGNQQLSGWINGWYFNTSLQPHIGIKKNILNRGDWKYYVGFSNAFSLSLYKSMYKTGFPITHRFSRRTFEPFANELFITTGIQKGRKSYHIDLRAINMKFLDAALENNGKSLDFYNPFKIRLRVAYNLHAKE
jgi:hypothetical protein